MVINKPPVNVLDGAVLGELAEQLSTLHGDDSIAALLLSGEGRCFSAGASVAEHKADQAEGMLDGLLAACTALADYPAPVAALVHGPCLGGAAELISFCDFVVADPSATIGQPEIKLAFLPPVACCQLPRIAGLQNASYAILTGESLSAEQAATMGLVQRILAKDEWDKIDKIFNNLSAAALRVTKEAIQAGTGGYQRQSLEQLKQLFLDRLYKLEDLEEGIASFEERRKPAWKHC